MAPRSWTEATLSQIVDTLEGQSPEAILQWAYAQFDNHDIALACSFGAEDVALVDMIAKIRSGARVFYLDTDVLFPETYAVIEKIKATYDVQIERCVPGLSLVEQANRHGDSLWANDPDACCSIRKVEPLKAMLAGLQGWITGIRRDQAPTRAHARVVEWDEKFGLVKLNPLAAWKDRDVWTYIMANEVPYNALHDQDYPSIGCIHCTRPVGAGEDPRSGRWNGLAKSECGLRK